ncbi:MAG: hypothetical protein IIC49_07660 [Planctomycetes bacterium]|nr:hypothetical protein [Planctomycetota bacterium]
MDKGYGRWVNRSANTGWDQRDYRLTADGVETVYRRGAESLCDAAKASTRLPGGHPEAFIEAFANVYRNACDAMRATASARGGDGGGDAFDYPDVTDGARGVRFIEKAVQSSRSDRKWISMHGA